MAPITLYVKANLDEPSKLGDCPFCHRVYLYLKLKKLETKLELIDFYNKPEWLIRVNDGKVPVIQETEGGEYLPDSDKIVERLEEIAPEPSLRPKTPSGLGAKIFPAFRAAVLNPSEANDQILYSELDTLEKYLSENADKGAFFGGAYLDGFDAAFSPKLYHIIVAMKALRDITVLDKYPLLAKYFDAVSATPEWKETDYGEAAIISGWKRHQAMHNVGKH
nr:glutathione s-transferase (DHAR3), chloroplastic [Polytomella parva]|eukprot:CAMPEP_0175059554 /NCGR_PEP_ID=MMETSP0052_2-20121109/12496_1 /TAXON_ID=51329 ORGANISM="Polytomella parva, Strain SAG 63-3" /NCGR_SAMPLE_ID=MMETSP0052_2 /ASSEMBLY_ACC=CAM_ASM_000194 /LENGTH=220 /DNA_ID=CAMNT_0016325115 /DNA_START=264 /DNA_END=926 /DNA_ORIENTATION=-